MPRTEPPRPPPPRPASDRSGPRRCRLALGLAIALLLGPAASLLPSQPAAAHTRSISYSSWEIGPERVDVRLRVPLLELSRLGPEAVPVDGAGRPSDVGLPAALAERVTRQVQLLADGTPCPLARPARRRTDEPGWVRIDWALQCPPSARRLAIRSHFLLDVAPSHMHFARVREGGGSGGVRERVLTEAAPEWVLREAGDASAAGSATRRRIGSRIGDYVGLGIEHILTGWDHLAFVFGLLLLARRLGEVARLVTGFTVAHSLTLALAVEGWVRPDSAAVESIIAFSVALVAIEKGWLLSDRARIVPFVVLGGILLLAVASGLGWSALPTFTGAGLLLFTACYFALADHSHNAWLRVCLTFAFGLVHGLGFAGILLEMSLPPDRLVPALLGFNVGVEIGQLAVVAVAWPLLVLGARWAPSGMRRLATEVAAAAICGLGLYWFAERAFPY